MTAHLFDAPPANGRPASREEALRAWQTTPPAVTPYTAQCHAIPVHWKIRNPERLIVGPEPKLALAVRARRNVELRFTRVDFPKLGDAVHKAAVAEWVLVRVPHVTGQRRLKPEFGTEPWVWGQENVAAGAMFRSDRPDELAALAPEIRWYGGTVDCLVHTRVVYPEIWSVNPSRVEIPKGGWSLGVIVRCSEPTPCFVTMAGV